MSDQERIAELEAIIREALADIDNANLDSPSDRLWNARITLSRAPQGAAEPEKTVSVSWYDHDCEWLTKYCDEYHRKSARVPVSVLRKAAEQ